YFVQLQYLSRVNFKDTDNFLQHPIICYSKTITSRVFVIGIFPKLYERTRENAANEDCYIEG
ncbi:MAG: hypothetical protein ACLRSA_04470, partial [Streptococcus salivarius]